MIKAYSCNDINNKGLINMVKIYILLVIILFNQFLSLIKDVEIDVIIKNKF